MCRLAPEVGGGDTSAKSDVHQSSISQDVNKDLIEVFDSTSHTSLSLRSSENEICCKGKMQAGRFHAFIDPLGSVDTQIAPNLA